MKHILLLLSISSIAFCACQKNNDHPSGSDPWDGKQLAGKWTPVKMTVSLKFDDGSVQNVTVPLEAGDFMEFVYSKTETRTSEGTYTTRGVGFTSSGTWDLENWNGKLTYRTVDTAGIPVFLYRHIQTLEANKLILTADDQLTKQWAEINGLQSDTKKIIGGSAYEEYSK